MLITVRELESGAVDNHIRSLLAKMLTMARCDEQKQIPHLASLIELGSDCLAAGLLAGEPGWFVAQDNKALLGMVRLAFQEPAEIVLSGLYVIPQARHKGIGTQLLQAVIQASRCYSAKKITVMVAENNPAVHFYQALGFISVRRARLPEYIVMELQINNGG